MNEVTNITVLQLVIFGLGWFGLGCLLLGLSKQSLYKRLVELTKVHEIVLEKNETLIRQCNHQREQLRHSESDRTMLRCHRDTDEETIKNMKAALSSQGLVYDSTYKCIQHRDYPRTLMATKPGKEDVVAVEKTREPARKQSEQKVSAAPSRPREVRAEPQHYHHHHQNSLGDSLVNAAIVHSVLQDSRPAEPAYEAPSRVECDTPSSSWGGSDSGSCSPSFD